jgi:DNA-binding transcriptional LysR family regulator
MVAAGNGVTMIPQAATHLISKGVVFRSLPTPVPMLAHTFAWRRSEALPPIENFVKLLKS